MNRELSPNARKKLQTQRDNLLLRGVAKCTLSHHASQEILAWCDDAEITPGRLLGPTQYQFSLEGIAQIEQRLIEEGFSPLNTDFSQLDRVGAARVDANEKRGQIRPTAHLLLVALTQGELYQIFNHTFYPSLQCNIEVDVNALQIAQYDTLLIIENRDSFNEWYKFNKPSALGKVLVVYRGDKAHSSACKQLRARWHCEQPQAPMVYFGDLDLAGLRIAISGGYQGLLLPTQAWLSSRLVGQHYPAPQLRFREKLHIDCPVGWRKLLELMQSQHAGLRQQWMLDADLTIYLRLS